MEHASLESDSRSGSQAILRLLRNMKVSSRFRRWSLFYARWIQSTPSYPFL